MVLSGEKIILEVVRNLSASCEPLRRTVVVPSVFRVYLCRSDLDRLHAALEDIRSEAIAALDEEVIRLNRPGRFSGMVGRVLGLRRREYTQARGANWQVDFLEDPEGELRPGDLRVLSELKVAAPLQLAPGNATRLVPLDRPAESYPPHPDTNTSEPATSPGVHARIRFCDDRGDREYAMSQPAIIIGRGGGQRAVDLRVHGATDISREHARIRLDGHGGYLIEDLSRNGVLIDGVPVPPDTEVPLPTRATISLAGIFVMEFEAVPVR